MTFQELAQSLPNGFHDAELHRLEIDYVQQVLRMELVVWIGRMSARETRELYRPAEVVVEKVGFLAMESPDENSPWNEAGALTIDTGTVDPQECSFQLPPVPTGTSVTRVYVYDWNRDFYFAGANAQLEWTGPEVNRDIDLVP